MRICSNLLILTSSLLYAGAFIASDLCYWFVFIFLIPLYWWAATNSNLPLWVFGVQGFVWGAVFFSIHMYALLCMFIEQTTLFEALVVWALFVVYCSSVAACWFVVAAFIGKRTRSIGTLLSVWVIATGCYIEYIDRFLFRCISLPRGYGLAYPLVPLAQCPALLMCLQWLPPLVLIFCISSSASVFVYSLIAKHRYSGLFCGVLLLPCLGGLLCSSQKAFFPYEHSFIHLQSPVYKNKHTVTELDVAQAINQQIHSALQEFPEATCLFFPESTYPFALDLDQDMYQLWKDNALIYSEKANIIIGAHHSCKDNLGNKARKNSIFYFDSCRIIPVYDKQTYVPFAEFVPWPWNKSCFLRNFLLKNKKGFHQENSVSKSLLLCPELTVSCYICSDLFFNTPRVHEGNSPILWLVHDTWSDSVYYRKLMVLYAQLISNLYNRNILYIGDKYGVWLTPFLQRCYLSSIMFPKNVN